MRAPSARHPWLWRGALTLALAALVWLVGTPLAFAGSDLWGNVGPGGQGGGGLVGRYPLVNYSLDQHFDAISASLTGGVDVSGVPPMIAYFLASVLWLLTSFLANLLISLFSFAFSLDLVNGSEATGGAGALAPVSRAIHSIYADVFGAPWLVLAVAIAGMWAMWKALVQRRYSETAGALGLSLVFVVLALFFVAQPGKTIGSASALTNRMSESFLSISERGSPSGGGQAKRDAADRLFDLLVYKPWVVLNFGGLEHCVVPGTGSEDSDPESVAVRPLASDPGRDAALARRLRAGTEVAAEGKTCVNNANKYAHRFLRYSLSGSEREERSDEYEALNDGDASGLPDAERTGYRLTVADKPATDAMEEGGQYQRLLLALVLFVGELGAFLLLGALSVGVILAQVLLLLLLAFAPVALVAAAIPGRGHDFFKGWLEKLAGYLLKKAAYSLILAVLLAVNAALATATAGLGWLMSFGLQSLFFWAVFLQRRTLTESLIGIATGPRAPGREGTLRVLALYYGARTAARPLRGAGRRARSAMRAPSGLFGGGGAERAGGPRQASRLGTTYSAPVGGDAPPLDAPRPSERKRSAAPQSDGESRKAASPQSGQPTDAPPVRKPAAAKGAGKRSRQAQTSREPEAPSSEKAGGERAKPGRVAKREEKRSADRPPVQRKPEGGEPERSLGEELRAEREELGREKGKRPPKRGGGAGRERPKRRGRKGGPR